MACNWHFPEVESLAALLADGICNSHGEGALLFDNGPDLKDYLARDAWIESKDRLELWSLDVRLPGSVNAYVTVTYYCAINTIGTFHYDVFSARTDDDAIRSAAAAKWEGRAEYLSAALAHNAERIAQLRKA